MAIDCYKHVMNAESSLNHMFSKVERICPTRRINELAVHVPNVRSEVGGKAYSFHGPVCWNSIQAEIKLRKPLKRVVHVTYYEMLTIQYGMCIPGMDFSLVIL